MRLHRKLNLTSRWSLPTWTNPSPSPSTPSPGSCSGPTTDSTPRSNGALSTDQSGRPSCSPMPSNPSPDWRLIRPLGPFIGNMIVSPLMKNLTSVKDIFKGKNQPDGSDNDWAFARVDSSLPWGPELCYSKCNPCFQEWSIFKWTAFDYWRYHF